MLPVAAFLAFRGSVLAVLVFGVCGVGVRLLLDRAWDTTTNERRLTPVTDDFDGVAVAVRTLGIWPASYYALVIALWVVAVAVLAQT